MVPKEKLEALDQLQKLDLKEPKDPLDRMVFPEYKELKVQEETKEIQGHLEQLDLKAKLEMQDQEV